MIRGLEKILYGITVQQFHDHISKCLQNAGGSHMVILIQGGGLYEYFIYNKTTNMKHLLYPWSKQSV